MYKKKGFAISLNVSVLTAFGSDAEGEDGRGDGASGRHEAHLKFAGASDDAAVHCKFVFVFSCQEVEHLYRVRHLPFGGIIFLICGRLKDRIATALRKT